MGANVSDWLKRAGVTTGSTGKPTVSESAGEMPAGTAGPTGQEPSAVMGSALAASLGYQPYGVAAPGHGSWSQGDPLGKGK